MYSLLREQMTKFNALLSINVVIILCIFWFWYMTANYPAIQHVPYEQINFKTGDVILFHSYNNINPVFIGSFWGHVGIVFKDLSGNPLIFEAAKTSQMKNCSDYNKHGIMITDLQTRLQKYPGMIACKLLNRPVHPDIVRQFTEFMIYAKQNMFYEENIFHSAIQKKLGRAFTHGTNCGELVFLSLIKLALLPENMINSSISHHLLYVARLEKLQDNYFHKPIEITFDPF